MYAHKVQRTALNTTDAHNVQRKTFNKTHVIERMCVHTFFKYTLPL